MSAFPGRLGIVQRVLPAYRVQFFDMLAEQTQGLSVFAGYPRPKEAITSAKELAVAHWQRAKNLHLLDGPLYMCYQRGLLDWLDETNPDVLVVEANPRYLSIPRAVRWMHARSRPVLGWGLGAPTVSGWRAARRLRFLQQFDGLIAYSQHGAEQYRAAGFPAERVFVAPNSVAPRPAGLPAKMDSGETTLLYVGRIQERKRLDVLLHACAALPPALQPRLVLVGDGPALPELQALAQRVYPRAEFTGHLGGEALERRFNEADLFVLPGTGGLAMQQAMAHALPVIVAKGDGSQADLVSPANGWLLPHSDDAALRAALEEALQDRVKLRKMGEASFKVVRGSFSLDSMVAGFIEALNAVKG